MVLQALQSLGIDFVTTANNHAMDRGSNGADLTLAELEKAGIGALGTIRAGASRDFVLHKQTAIGTISFVACSYSTNGRTDAARQVLLCYRDKDELLGIVRREVADPLVAGVIVLPHWGQEYSSTPDGQQIALAQDLVDAGASAIVGTHPHAVQPFDMLQRFDGISVPVVYSTGNFVAAQDFVPARFGALAMLAMCKSPDGRGLVTEHVGWIATQMEFTPQAFWLDVAPIDTDEDSGAAYRHLSIIAPGYSVQPARCEP